MDFVFFIIVYGNAILQVFDNLGEILLEQAFDVPFVKQLDDIFQFHLSCDRLVGKVENRDSKFIENASLVAVLISYQHANSAQITFLHLNRRIIFHLAPDTVG